MIRLKDGALGDNESLRAVLLWIELVANKGQEEIGSSFMTLAGVKKVFILSRVCSYKILSEAENCSH